MTGNQRTPEEERAAQESAENLIRDQLRQREEQLELLVSTIHSGESYCNVLEKFYESLFGLAGLIDSTTDLPETYAIEARGRLQQFKTRLNTTLECLNKIQTKAVTVEVAKTDKKLTTYKKLDPPHFDGDVEKWPAFWAHFENSFHNNESFDDLQKFHYLLQGLNEKAKTCIEGLTVTNENYKNAIRALKDKYDNKDVLAERYYKRLDCIIKAKTSVECQTNLEQIQTIVHNLTTLDVEINQDILKNKILSCFPFKLNNYITRKVEKGKLENTVKAIIDKLAEEVRYMMKSANSDSLRPTASEPASSSLSAPQGVAAALVAGVSSNSNDNVGPSSASASSTSRGGSRSGRPFRGRGRGNSRTQPYSRPVDNAGERRGNANNAQQCIFCSRWNHQSGDCTEILGWKSRKSALIRSNRCLTCTATDHRQADCPLRNSPCSKCQRTGHQYAMCIRNIVEIQRRRRGNRRGGNSRGHPIAAAAAENNAGNNAN